jgi:hypothetical protein
VAPNPKIQRLLAAIHNSGPMNHCQVCHGSIYTISMLDPFNVKEAYSHIASYHHSVQWNLRSH